MTVGFVEYLDPEPSLEDRVTTIAHELGIEPIRFEAMQAFLAPVKIKDRATYRHSMRVAILTQQIGRFIHMDEKALFYAGYLHDVGKAQTKLTTLQRRDTWTPEDAEEIKSHVWDGYRLLRGYFDFTAEIILWHHRFQKAGYPEVLPESLHGYSEGTKTMIPFYGRMLSLADTFDAMHRINSRGSLSGEEIRARMFSANPDQKKLITDLYESDILTTRTLVLV